MDEPLVVVKDVQLPAGDSYYYDRTEHLWARLEGEGRVRVGLSAFAQKAAGAIAYVKLKPAGKPVQKGRAFGSIEAGKYIGPLKSPATGSLEAVNAEALENPGLLNTDPYGRGWLAVIEATELSRDLADLVHGEDAIRRWIEEEYNRYVAEGLFAE
ncbi:MAG: glycine cleavage system protein H [Myxococcales bacterium]|nr:glycine cleavage system protein H [Myxococcales bacterium]